MKLPIAIGLAILIICIRYLDLKKEMTIWQAISDCYIAIILILSLSELTI